MKDRIERKGYTFGKRLYLLHFWNALFFWFLALSGLLIFSGPWQQILGRARAEIKWLHISIGLISIVPILSYLRIVRKHWKQLEGKLLRRFNIIVMSLLFTSLLISGIMLWQFHSVGPSASNAALFIHDLLTWLGLPIIIYHSLTRSRFFKEPLLHRNEISSEEEGKKFLLDFKTKPFWTRRGFIRTIIGTGLTILMGPFLLRWIFKAESGQPFPISNNKDANKLIPAPQPLPDSAPPIGGGANGSFRSYTVTEIPSFNNDNWSFTIDGLVEEPVSWNWEQFIALKRSVQVSDFHCVTGWSVYRNTWEGIPLKELLNRAKVKPQARVVKFYSGDGVYTDSLTLKQASLDDIMVVVMHDGKPISDELGGPVRLIIPQMYAYKSVKWLNRIELIENDYIGYWGQRGYANDAWIQG